MGAHCRLRTRRSELSAVKIMEIFGHGGDPSGRSDLKRWRDCGGGTLRRG